MKKILIISNMLNSGGVEVSMINFITTLRELNKDLKIDLLLSRNDGPYKEKISKIVNNIYEVPYIDNGYNLSYKFSECKSLKSKLLRIIYRGFKYFFKKIGYERLIYKYILNKTKEFDIEYDLAIDYHSYGYFNTAYVIKKIKASKKVIFIHDEKIDFINHTYNYVKEFDKIFCVANSVLKKVKNEWYELSNKLDILHNILDTKSIIEKSNQKIYDMDDNIFTLLTVGRLEKQKGYDLLMNIAKKLKENNLIFKWYIIGTGSLYSDIKKLIKKEKLENNVIILGRKENPYPYMKSCNIYVQPSRHEGYGIAIAEARVLRKIIIATDIECIGEQIIDNKNGFLCKFDVDDFYNKIFLLYHNKNKYNEIQDNINNISVFNEYKEDIIKILQLI